MVAIPKAGFSSDPTMSCSKRVLPVADLQICSCCLKNGGFPMLTCISCSTRVHAECYGIVMDSASSGGVWRCSPCSSPFRARPICAICNIAGGALKRTKDQRWAHVCCALWVPETWIEGGCLMEPIVNLHRISLVRQRLRCLFCKAKGGCIQCTSGRCSAAFHVICGVQHGLDYSIRQRLDTVQATALCPKHTNRQALLPKPKVQTQGTLTLKDNVDEIICDVCYQDHDQPDNDIVICDGCDTAVHQRCHGITSIPEDAWFCRACKAGVIPSCVLCPDIKGALTRTDSGSWVHISCALWARQAFFLKAPQLDVVTGLEELPLNEHPCSVCASSMGYCPPCAFPGCSCFFHVRCAQRSHRRVQILSLKHQHGHIVDKLPKFGSRCSKLDFAFIIFCQDHESFSFEEQSDERKAIYKLLEKDEDVVVAVDDNNTTDPFEDVAPSDVVDDRSNVQKFWDDRVRPYFVLSSSQIASLSSSSFDDISFVVPPVVKGGVRDVASFVPTTTSGAVVVVRCDGRSTINVFGVDEQLLSWATIDDDDDEEEDAIVDELKMLQTHLTHQLMETNVAKERLLNTINEEEKEEEEEVKAPLERYVQVNHAQVVRMCLVQGFRDIHLTEADHEIHEHFNTTCRVCFGMEGTEVNPIVICERCGLAVHKYCYGIEEIPDEDWYCLSCSRDAIVGMECLLCPLSGFAHKPTDNGHVHLSCALWSRSIVNWVTMDLKLNWTTNNLPVCHICSIDYGRTEKCRSCSVRMHVTCAWEDGLFLAVQSIDGAAVFSCWCTPHTPEHAGGACRDRRQQRDLRLQSRPRKPIANVATTTVSDQVMEAKHEVAPADKRVQPRCLVSEDQYLPDVCGVCFKAFTATSPMISCRVCWIAVHLSCYHVFDGADSETWRCSRCHLQHQRATRIQCTLCPRFGGVYVRREPRWVHSLCLSWRDYLSDGQVGMGAPRLLCDDTCSICSSPTGFLVDCTAPDCPCVMHPLCAHLVGCAMSMSPAGRYTALCGRHSPIPSRIGAGADGPGAGTPRPPYLFLLYDRLRRVREDMDRVRALVDLVREREAHKQRLLTVSLEIQESVVSARMRQRRDREHEERLMILIGDRELRRRLKKRKRQLKEERQRISLELRLLKTRRHKWTI